MATVTKSIGATARDYSTMTLWDADLDDAAIYSASDDAVGECYNDSVFDETVVCDGGDTIGLNSMTLTVAAGERHDGTAGTGARIVRSTAVGGGLVQLVNRSSWKSTVSWLEISGGGNGVRYGIDKGQDDPCDIHNVIVHGLDRNDNVVGIRHAINGLETNIYNCIVYDIRSSYNGATQYAVGINIDAANATARVLNCTIHDITKDTNGLSYGIGFADDADVTIQNCVVGDVDGTTALAKVCYEHSSPSNATCTYNAASDATASGTGSITSITTADQFVSTVGGSEDLHLKEGSGCIGAGTDLVDTPTGVKTDINGANRDSLAATVWDIGAHQYEQVASIGATARDYSTMALWEADLDDTSIYGGGSRAKGECYNDADFTGFVKIDAIDIDLEYVTLTAASGERHDGTAGTGCRILGNWIDVHPDFSYPATGTYSVEISWIEIDRNSRGSSQCIELNRNADGVPHVVHACILHGHGKYGISNGTYMRGCSITNNFIYDGLKTTHDSIGIMLNGRTTTDDYWMDNNTIFNINAPNESTGDAFGIQCQDRADHYLRNNVVCDVVGAISSQCFQGHASTTEDHNVSSDSTAQGTGSITDVTTADQFVSTVGSSEDLHLKAGSDCIDAGTDLGTTSPGVNIDINGRDRDAEADTWDIGAHEFIVAAAVVGWTRSLTPSPVRPSYKSGFARSAAESAYPGLWKGIIAATYSQFGTTGTSIVRDVTGNNRHQVVDAGSDIQFDGIGTDTTRLTQNVEFPTSGCTWVAKAMLYGESTEPTLFSFSGGGSQFYLRCSSSSEKVQVLWDYPQSGYGNILDPTALTFNKWYVLSVTYDGSELRLYKDGELIGTDTSNMGVAIPDIYVGSKYGGGRNWNGKLQASVFYNRALPPNEIRQLARDPIAPFRLRRFTPTYPTAAEAATTTSVGWTRSLTPSPVRPSYKSGFARSAAESSSPGLWKGLVGAWCPWMGVTGSNLQDLSVNNYTGAVIGATWGQSERGSHLILDGVSDGVTVTTPEKVMALTSGYTFSCWYRTTAAAFHPGHTLIERSSGWKNGTILLAVGGSITGREIQWILNTSGTDSYLYVDDSSWNDGAWHFVTGTYGNGTSRLYYDGVEIGSGLVTAQTALPSDNLYIGSRIGSQNEFTGDLGSVSAWDRALSPQEIRQLYRDPLAPFRQRRFTPTYSPVAEEAAATTSVGWTRSLTPSPVRPSYKSGFARSAAESSSPGLWKGMYSSGMGSQLHDIAARQPVSFYSNTADRIVGKYGEAWHFNDTRNAEAITLNHLGNTWLDGATEFTYGLAFRYHGTDASNEDTLMGQWSQLQGGNDNNAKRAIIRYDSNNNQMDWFLDDGNDEGMITAVSIEDDDWHVVLHRFESGEQTGWIDGALVATDSTPDTTIQSAVHSKVPEIAGGHQATI